LNHFTQLFPPNFGDHIPGERELLEATD